MFAGMDVARDVLQGLPPLVTADCRVLVLGSMPGAASLSASRYYAHPRNRFWPLMGELFGFDPGLPYRQRIDALHRAGVGLWDVIGQCERRGSLDASIVPGSEVPNAIAPLVESLPGLRAIALNGGKAAQAFRRHVWPTWAGAMRQRVAIHALPSTSPANAACGLPRLLAEWSVIGPDPPRTG